jgi:hypothetical protein
MLTYILENKKYDYREEINIYTDDEMVGRREHVHSRSVTKFLFCLFMPFIFAAIEVLNNAKGTTLLASFIAIAGVFWFIPAIYVPDQEEALQHAEDTARALTRKESQELLDLVNARSEAEKIVTFINNSKQKTLTYDVLSIVRDACEKYYGYIEYRVKKENEERVLDDNINRLSNITVHTDISSILVK